MITGVSIKIKVFLITFVVYFGISAIIENEYTVNSLLYTAIEAIIFAFILSLFDSYIVKNIVGNIKIDLEENENIILECPASYKKDNSYFVGGKLAITNKRLVFKPHFLNFNPTGFSVLLNDINDVTTFSIVADNGLQLTTTNGNIIKLSVENRDELFNMLIQK